MLFHNYTLEYKHFIIFILVLKYFRSNDRGKNGLQAPPVGREGGGNGSIPWRHGRFGCVSPNKTKTVSSTPKRASWKTPEKH